MNDLDRLTKYLMDLPAQSFRELGHADPLVRFHAARRITEMAASKKHETSAGVVCHMDAGALRRVAEDPDWKVRRAGRAAINAVARYLGPEIGIAADSGRDPMEVCEIVQAFRERFELAAEALAEEATADFRRGPNTRSQPGRLAVKLMQ